MKNTNRQVVAGKAYIRPQRSLEPVSPHTRLASGQRSLETAPNSALGFPKTNAEPRHTVLNYQEWLKPQGRRAAEAATARPASEPPLQLFLAQAASQASDTSETPPEVHQIPSPEKLYSSQPTPKNQFSSSIPFQYIRAFFKACIVLFLAANGLYIGAVFAFGYPKNLAYAYLMTTQGIVQTVRCGWNAPVELHGWGCLEEEE